MSEEKKITGRECRFAIHMPTRSSDIPDRHLIKECVHYEDGTTERRVRFEKDYKRAFYVTKKPFRNHKQKKESESLDKVLKFTCTQSNMKFHVCRALETNKHTMEQLAASPYLYGSDISSTSLIKYDYQKKWADLFSDYAVLFFDIETDMINGTKDPIIITSVFEGVIYSCIDKNWLKGYSDIDARINEVFEKHLSKYREKYNFKLEVQLLDGPVELIRESFKFIHKVSPDFVAIWNLDFDIPRILDTLEKYGVDAKNIFSDPRIPEELRFCKYKKGSTKKITASGQTKPKAPSEQWHSLLCPAGFYIIDAMSSYRFIRQGEQELSYYTLDFVLKTELGVRKLNFDEAKGLEKADWHEFMQESYPFEYIVYNFFDCIGMLELEQKNKDLSQKLPILCDITDFSRFNSQTKRFADGYHFFLLENENQVLATLPPREKKPELIEVDEDDVVEDDDEENGGYGSEESPTPLLTTKDDVLSLKNWIVTLVSHLSTLGLPLIKESRLHKTLIRLFTYDSDAVSAYPSATAVGNVSRGTTKKELIDIVGIDEDTFKLQNINLLQGHTNAIEYACTMHELPTPQEALALFDDM